LRYPTAALLIRQSVIWSEFPSGDERLCNGGGACLTNLYQALRLPTLSTPRCSMSRRASSSWDWAISVRALSDADFVQENGPERAEFKIKLFADLDQASPVDSIIASSSSGLTMTVMQTARKKRGFS